VRYRDLGATGVKVSELSLGAARGARENPREFVATVRACAAAGINLVDTAESYEDGESERLLGEALRGHPDVLVETKYRPYDSHSPEAKYTGTPGALTASVEASLRRLGRERVDILLGHGIRTLASLERFMQEGCYEAMTRLREAGKARFIGVSELSEGDGTHEVLRKIVPTGAFDVVMLTVNVLLQTAIDELLPLCRKHGVGTVVMMPLNQASRQSGLVSVEAALECVRRHVEQGNLPAAPPYTEPTLFDFLAPLSVPEASLRFVLSQDVSTVCVGMRSSRRLTENLRALRTPYLSDALAARIRELFGSIRRQVR
jgi:aryl-alcohol dehydrogenase-like predicted oxidoreductase